MSRKSPFDDFGAGWPGKKLYLRFEQFVAMILATCVSVVILVTTAHVVINIAKLIGSGVIDPSKPEVFHTIFGMIMTVLIAIEFNHSIRGLLDRDRSALQVRTVVLIALLAVLRKFIILEVTIESWQLLIALSASALSLGAIYYFLREQDRRAYVPKPDASETKAETKVETKAS